jgi:hypothetical protein
MVVSIPETNRNVMLMHQYILYGLQLGHLILAHRHGTSTS